MKCNEAFAMMNLGTESFTPSPVCFFGENDGPARSRFPAGNPDSYRQDAAFVLNGARAGPLHLLAVITLDVTHNSY